MTTGSSRREYRGRGRLGILVALLAIAASACGSTGSNGPVSTAPAGPVNLDIPRPGHVVVLVMENHGLDDVLGSPDAPYLNRLVRHGAVFTNASAITHPSYPNYLALFSGDTHGVTDDNCPYSFSAPNLGQQLRDAHLSFASFSEDLPKVGYTGCQSGDYARRHNPVVTFSNDPASDNQPFSAFGPNYAALPTVSFVIPNLCHDMHDCGVGVGDRWTKDNIGGYVRWAQDHNSLLIVTWDEAENNLPQNQIPLIFAGPMVKPGSYDKPVDHYDVLRTLEAMYGLPRIGHAISATPVTTTWRR